MPNIWTHALFGQQLLAEFKEEAPPIKDYEGLFQLGCQGPDFLLYHNFLPWKTGKQMSELGGSMHRKNCGPVLLDFFTKSKQLEDSQIKEEALAYFIGFLTHHIMDRNFHPYVHCKAGYRKWDHQRFEVIMDTIFVEKMKGWQTWNTPAWKQIDAGEQLPQAVASILRDTVATWYPEAEDVTEADWQQAYRDMLNAQKLFHDPWGWKRVVTFGQIEPLMYKKHNKPLDYLNENHAEWQHPAVEDETHTYSAWDLWDHSMEDGRAVLAPLLQWLNDSDDRTESFEQFKAVLGNRSYDHGKDCDSGLEVRYSQPIWV